MTGGFLSLLLLILTRTVTAEQLQVNDTCCYGTSQNIANGHVIESFPSQCMQLLCHQGINEPRYYDDPMACGCCVHNGKMYRDGERIDGVCTDLTCREGRWITKGYIDECCEMCRFQNDPHITTYDGYHYDWHGTCNYSMSQPNFGYQESFGIYGQYKQCNGLASCVDITTFQDNPHTVIQVTAGQGPNVLVNNNPFVVQGNVEGLPVGDPSQPVLSWTDGSCNWFLGSQGFLLMTCAGEIYIWAYPNLVGQLNGLCGHLSLYQPDDFTDRSGFPHSMQYYPYAFPVSWLTSVQTKTDCGSTQHGNGGPNGAPNPCTLDKPGLANLNQVCTTLFLNVNWQGKKGSKIIINIAIQACVADLCLMHQNGATQQEIEDWKIQMQIMLEIRIRIEVMTTVGALPPPQKSQHTGCKESGGCGQVPHVLQEVVIKSLRGL